MSKYCVACGAALGGKFCGACGQAATDSMPVDPSTTAATTGSSTTGSSPAAASTTATEALSPIDAPVTAQTSAPAPRRRLRIGALSAGAAILASVAVLTGLAMNSQAAPEPASDPAATAAGATAVKTVAKSTDISQKRLMKAKIKARAERKAERQAEREAAAAQAQSATTAAAMAPDSSGQWAGSLADGKYSYYLDIEESGGAVAGSMYQVSNADGDSGTEYVTGYREGNTLYLQGQYWTDAPKNWGLDSFTIELSSDGGSVWGSYNCDVCSTTNNLSGERSYGDY